MAGGNQYPILQGALSKLTSLTGVRETSAEQILRFWFSHERRLYYGVFPTRH